MCPSFLDQKCGAKACLTNASAMTSSPVYRRVSRYGGDDDDDDDDDDGDEEEEEEEEEDCKAS